MNMTLFLITLLGIIVAGILKFTQDFLKQKKLSMLYPIAESAVLFAEQWGIKQIKKYNLSNITGDSKFNKALDFIRRHFPDLDKKSLELIKDLIEAKVGEINIKKNTMPILP